MTSIFHSGLSKDFSSILNDADDFNVIIQVGKNEYIKEFHAHSVILRTRSPYFRSALSNKWITKNNDMIIFNKPNISPLVFEMILKYIYTGELDLTNYQSEDILELLVASDELLLEELFEHVQDNLIEKQTTWVQENFVLVLHTVFKLLNCKKLQTYCLESICSDPRSFITSKNFPSLDKDILYNLLERDDLPVEEVIIWECLIKWGIEQTPGFESNNNDRTKWNNENYEALRETLSQFIPLIRFVEISAADYLTKVRPYKAIIPNIIHNEVEEFYFNGTIPKTINLPPRVGKSHIESKIIKIKLISTIINWINKKDAKAIRNKNDSLYNFDLIYRGSQSGINNNSFRNKCNLRLPILVLIKCQNTKKIFGGYTPVGFYSNDSIDGLIYSENSFIFSFEDDTYMKNIKLSRVISYDYAIYNNYYYGFNFGGDALCMENQNLYANGNEHYEKNVSDDNNIPYIIEEIEAFRVVKL
ncbi:hypothetical protein GLOIN_2v1480795 [Rhizophagus irregularis DAOM 181602=DAOM 197198]|uniref:Uncharacterized protein n=4 Tax=Rhizophagus irregularis TaxID=588596 RepID=U9U9J0_RHIID|nr:hypothetical protein GLOIN_2v1480795 [Rhizophagus irregularis DAOM 181602=DAOM 197198]EXX67030.1 hypothetical protein RirG_118160 [Rhizophagus irregularis DAOM 197198w]POG68467.1 hypothetical protein GLOIN_2v1480795 [Rhizophagus irregularis DAOM 181602=DAOM 197198]GBC38315.1 hypothetical protein GLOIN_2v1480795 [Rhizophagus irregularis DAOM 181602=DAOM 197198]|eukprot:XP_025175333.1 hypothetical protein GLOIN_2v1480795 [Rhizophagus irregularis DAOM 181602=DAOM 197198]